MTGLPLDWRSPGLRAGARRRIVLAILAAAAVSMAILAPWLGPPWPSPAGLGIALDFVAAAFSPALWSADPQFRDAVGPIPLAALAAAGRTVAFAASAMVLALAVAVPLGLLASETFWQGDGRGRATASILRVTLRSGLTALRSIHELLWAVVLLAALGASSASAVLAIALPYAGVLGKLFADIVDEAPRDARALLRATGASRVAAFAAGIVPRAFPDLASYAFYRFECALRSAAVLGFFGFPTLGLAIKQSFSNLNHHEVWTYLWTLFALIAAVEWWSGVLRRRLGR